MDFEEYTPKKFSLKIEEIARDKGITHFDAVLYYCEKNEIEVEYVSKMLTKALKDKIEINARNLKMMKDNVVTELPV